MGMRGLTGLLAGALLGGAILRASAASTPGDWVVDAWPTDGLPPDIAIRQTQDGYLWVGTLNGLARFDGVRFTTFRVADKRRLAQQPDSLPSGRMRGRVVGRHGRRRFGRLPKWLVQRVVSEEGLSADTVLCVLAKAGG